MQAVSGRVRPRTVGLFSAGQYERVLPLHELPARGVWYGTASLLQGVPGDQLQRQAGTDGVHPTVSAETGAVSLHEQWGELRVTRNSPHCSCRDTAGAGVRKLRVFSQVLLCAEMFLKRDILVYFGRFEAPSMKLWSVGVKNDPTRKRALGWRDGLCVSIVSISRADSAPVGLVASPHVCRRAFRMFVRADEFC